MSIFFDRERQEIAMAPRSCPVADNVPLWYLFTFSIVAFFACILFIVTASIGIYEWRAGRCCCCRQDAGLASESTTSPAGAEFATVQATLTPGIEGGYGAMNKIEQAKPIFDDDDDDDNDDSESVESA